MLGLPKESAALHEREQCLEELQARLGCVFQDRDLLLTALRHRSYVHQPPEGAAEAEALEDNQRLEFLGDAVLSLCVSTLLCRTFPHLKEGEMSKMRAGLVNESQLSDKARELGLPPCLFLGRGEEASGGRDKNSILADALEAVLAAVYLDQGFDQVLGVVERLWGDLIARSSEQDFLQDYKTRLQELTQQRFGQAPKYHLARTAGPDHARVFEVSLRVGSLKLSTGRGRSKKEAEQDAARSALDLLEAQAGSPP